MFFMDFTVNHVFPWRAFWPTHHRDRKSKIPVFYSITVEFNAILLYIIKIFFCTSDRVHDDTISKNFCPQLQSETTDNALRKFSVHAD